MDATGIAASGLVGYKFAARYGLTFDVQAGVAGYVIGARERQAQTGQTGSLHSSGVVPTALLNVGWSF